MRNLGSPEKNFAYLAYRIVTPILDPIKFVYGLFGYFWFIRDLVKYKLMDPKAKIKVKDLYPSLHNKTNFHPLDKHYYYQQLWAFEHVLKQKPKEHLDVASSYQFSGYISKITSSIFLDYRPIDVKLKNLKAVAGDILDLPYKDSSLESVSCLNVIEHIGLGRYGDPIDPDGFYKACLELQRVIKKGGKLYLSVPAGRNRVCFNSHRVISPSEVIKNFSGMRLVSFSAVDDGGEYHVKADPKDYEKSDFALGMYIFTPR